MEEMCDDPASVEYCTSLQLFCVLITSKKRRVIIFTLRGPKTLIYFLNILVEFTSIYVMHGMCENCLLR